MAPNFYVRSRQFCCCLPVRLGVFVMSLIHLFGSLAVAVVTGIAIEQILTKKVHDVTHKGLVELYVIAGVAGILALVSAFGFIGCIAKKLPLVVAYHVMIWVLLVVNIAASAFVLTGAWGRGGFEDDGHEVVLSKGDKVRTTVSIVINLLVHLYGCHIVGSYVRQLREQRVGYENLTPWAKADGRDVILPTEAEDASLTMHQV